MKIFFNKKMLLHNPDGYPEGNYRLAEFSNLVHDIEFNGEGFLTLVHTDKYVNKTKRASENQSVLAEMSLTKESYEAACLAVGLSILVSQKNGFALVRPPGHHANREKAAGFCLFNNIAIATQKLVNEGKRVCILDIDGHHGNGTQSIFYKSDKVLYCSVHQQSSFPDTGHVDEIGEGKGISFTINIPISKDSGDDIFLLALNKLLPIISKFNPDIVGVSAGFDGYHGDYLLNLNYSLHSYYECGLLLKKNFNNIFAVLEGGYHQNLKKCVDVFMAGVNKERVNIEDKKTVSEKVCYEIFETNTKKLKFLLNKLN